jgi:hypothetical protein
MKDLSNKLDNAPTSPEGLLSASEWNPFVDELLNILTAAGITPDENSTVQLLNAINFLVDAGLNSVGLKSNQLPYVEEIAGVPQIDGLAQSGFYAVRTGAIDGAGGDLPSDWLSKSGQGMLLHFASGGAGITQSQFLLKGGAFWVRFETVTNGAWNPWITIASESYVSALINLYGLGATQVAGSPASDGRNIANTQFVRWTTNDADKPFGEAAAGIHVQYQPTSKMQMAVTTSGQLVYQRVVGNTPSGWRKALDAPRQIIPLTGQAIRYTSTSQVTFPSEIYGANDTFTDTIFMAAGEVVDLSVNGLNGLDTGVAEANTWYHLFALRNPTTGVSKPIATKNPAGPTVTPSGYTQKLNCRMPFKTKVTSTSILNFRMHRALGMTACTFLEQEGDSSNVFLNIPFGSDTTVSFDKCIPTGETGLTATATLLVSQTSDQNGGWADQLAYKPTSGDTFVPFSYAVSNNAVVKEEKISDIILSPTGRTAIFTKVSPANFVNNKGRALGYKLYR